MVINDLKQGSPNILSSGPCIDFFGSPRAKAKNIVCDKQLINNCKRSEDLFSRDHHNFAKKYGNTRSIQSENLFFLEITMISFFLKKKETGAHFRHNSIQLWFKVSIYVF